MENLSNLFRASLLPKKAKEIIIKSLEKGINSEINGLISQIKNQKSIGKYIKTEAKTLLIESLNFIRK